MSASLVGSEMCIRDSPPPPCSQARPSTGGASRQRRRAASGSGRGSSTSRPNRPRWASGCHCPRAAARCWARAPQCRGQRG
eukprot:4469501-Alexandrium_andersonii.AAC.1